MSATAVWVPVVEETVGGERQLRADVDWGALRRVHQDEQFHAFPDGTHMPFAQIIVDDRDLAEGKPATRVPDGQVPEETREYLAMVRAVRRNACLVPKGLPRPAEARRHRWPSKRLEAGRVFYRPRPASNVRLVEPEDINEDTAEEVANRPEARCRRHFAERVAKSALDGAARKRLLLRAMDLGIDPLAAETIRAENGLPASKRRPVEGIDADIFDRAVAYVERRLRVDNAREKLIRALKEARQDA